jgi:hypothetical protein
MNHGGQSNVDTFLEPNNMFFRNLLDVNLSRRYLLDECACAFNSIDLKHSIYLSSKL